MSFTKIVVIVLAVCALLFVVLVVWGNHSNGGAISPSTQNALGFLNETLGAFAPKLELSPKQFDLSRATVAMPVRVTIPPDENHNYRKATFKITPPGCADIEYQAPAGDGDPNLNHQPYPGTQTKPDLKQASFTILRSGGTFTLYTPGLTRQGCLAELQ